MLISVPATSANLGPGFDTLGISLDLRNKIVIKPSKFHSISLKGEGSNNNLLKDNNLFLNIFRDFLYSFGTRNKNFRFEFFNEIPLSRGLGSSSAVIVSAILAAYRVENIDIDKQKLLNLSLSYEHHPDNITPAVMGGFTASFVLNEEVKFIKKEVPKDLRAVLVIPNRSISTNLSRKTLPNRFLLDDVVFNISHSSVLTAAFFSEQWDLLKEASKDKLHQIVRMRQLPELFEVQKIALNNGALMSTLSGSGSSFFNLVFYSDAKRLESILRNKFPYFRIFSVNFDNRGIIVEN